VLGRRDGASTRGLEKVPTRRVEKEKKLTRVWRRSLIVIVDQHHFPPFRPWGLTLRRWCPCICTNTTKKVNAQNQRRGIARGHGL
jgi:hypothetical protein